jgi:hypothetical protein
LENILLNPITAKRITIICGSVEAFLEDPSLFKDKFPDPNFKWMCNVSSLEAQISQKRMLAWAKSDKLLSGGSLGEWIFNRSLPNEFVEEVPELTTSLTANAIQKNWKTPSEFPCCPSEFTDQPIISYAQNLRAGSIFCQNGIYTSFVLKSALSESRKSLYVLSESKNGIKPWALAEITYENNIFVHESHQSFFTENGAEKQFCLAQGLEWHGEDSIDDYC